MTHLRPSDWQLGRLERLFPLPRPAPPFLAVKLRLISTPVLVSFCPFVLLAWSPCPGPLVLLPLSYSLLLLPSCNPSPKQVLLQSNDNVTLAPPLAATSDAGNVTKSKFCIQVGCRG